MATRLFSDALPTHLPAGFSHHRDADHIRTVITSGEGSSPALHATVRVGGNKTLSDEFAAVFGSWANAVEFLACQEAAIAVTEDTRQLAFAEIRLPIDLSRVLMAGVSGEDPLCSLLPGLQPTAGPFCFVVERVAFDVLSERLLPSAPTPRSSGLPAAAAEFER